MADPALAEVRLLENFLLIGGLLFAIGLVGFLSRRNMIVMFLSAELMLQAVSQAPDGSDADDFTLFQPWRSTYPANRGERIFGSGAADRIPGTPGPDRVSARGGADHDLVTRGRLGAGHQNHLDAGIRFRELGDVSVDDLGQRASDLDGVVEIDRGLGESRAGRKDPQHRRTQQRRPAFHRNRAHGFLL